VVIRATDRVEAVLARDEALVDVFVALSPAFERLRSPRMRKVMARLVTVGQAARIAGIDPDLLVERLNDAFAARAGDAVNPARSGSAADAGSAARVADAAGSGSAGSVPSVADAAGPASAVIAAGAASAASPPGTVRAPGAARSASTPHEAPPPHLAGVPPDRIVDLDVREDLRAGREPFSKIMAARRSLAPGGVLRVRAIFEPIPLYAVMRRQGLE